MEHENPPTQASLRSSTWSIRAFIAGIAMLVLWRSMAIVDQSIFYALPVWLMVFVTAFFPLLVLLFYPLVTRRQEPPASFRFPKLGTLAKEAAIAIALIVVCIITISFVDYI